MQLLDNNDKLTEQLKEATSASKEQETRADDLERDLKSLRSQYEALEGILL